MAAAECCLIQIHSSSVLKKMTCHALQKHKFSGLLWEFPVKTCCLLTVPRGLVFLC